MSLAPAELRRASKAPIISKQIRIRLPEEFQVGDYSVVDDFCYFSTRVRVGRCSHIASNCTIAGGRDRLFQLGDFSSVSAGVRIWCTSDDFVNDLVTLIPAPLELDPKALKSSLISEDVILENFTAVGANSVIMPGNRIPEGTVVGALSFVPARFSFEPWSVYAGNPIRFIKHRNKKNVLKQVQTLEAALRKVEEGAS